MFPRLRLGKRPVRKINLVASETAVIRRAPIVAPWVARGLLGLTGAAVLFGAVYFTFFATAAEGQVSGVVDWLIAVWAMAIAVGYLVAAVRATHASPRMVGFAVAIVAIHIVFGLVKLVGYGETESVPFFAVDLVILGLLAFSQRSRPPA